ncbi:MAG: 4Fe-4S double cluster binding domain-containing protein, partial [Anaerolineae bacterium]|nr:4Fe-4S double cluster binding domain-containing protein [Anaerolineae bacterium]
FFFLGVALLDCAIPSNGCKSMPSCGSCTRCLDACPTGALTAPGVLDARRCLSYLTIENRASIPVEYRSAMGNRLFGCDICQEVCPWNARPTVYSDQELVYPVLDLKSILEMEGSGFNQQFKRTALWRATPVGLARNAAVVLGNSQEAQEVVHARKIAQHFALHHPSALVREHLEWALDQLV